MNMAATPMSQSPKVVKSNTKVDPVSTFWRPAPSKVKISQKLTNILGYLVAVFLIDRISRSNGRLLPIACHSNSESLWFSGQFGLSGTNFRASYEASYFC